MSFEGSLTRGRPAPLAADGEEWDDPETEEADEDLDDSDEDRNSKDDDTA
jgi:hypothetical protein